MKGKLLPMLSAALTLGCTGKAVVAEPGPEGWPVEMVWENNDTLSRRTLSVLVRLRSDFRSDRLDLIVETLTPDSLHWRDTVTVRPSVPEAYSLTYMDIKTPYRSDVIFKRAGDYRFRFTPLRLGTLKKVVGVGIKVAGE
jgi:hypothetical protein